MKKIVAVIILLVLSIAQVYSQCAMCRANVESNMKSGENSIGAGLNSGILFLMAIPYLLAAVGFGIWFYHRRRNRLSLLNLARQNN
ncbi:MAG: hypothetical protein IPO27_15010 [Bacteroidetes bacterium]|nr:hypothetical protein [Bacteroidota bacterium]